MVEVGREESRVTDGHVAMSLVSACDARDGRYVPRTSELWGKRLPAAAPASTERARRPDRPEPGFFEVCRASLGPSSDSSLRLLGRTGMQVRQWSPMAFESLGSHGELEACRTGTLLVSDFTRQTYA